MTEHPYALRHAVNGCTVNSPQQHCLIQIWSLLGLKKQTGENYDAKLEASKQSPTNQ